MNLAESITKKFEASADSCEASFLVLCTQSFPMVFLSPPNSNGLALSTFQARTNPPLTRALARRRDSRTAFFFCLLLICLDTS